MISSEEYVRQKNVLRKFKEMSLIELACTANLNKLIR